MDGYTIAWIVIGVSAYCGAVGLWQLCSRSRFGALRWLATGVALTFFLTPVAVPNYPEQLAPAFVIAIFEMFFQSNGEPQASLRILGLALTSVSVLILVVYFFLQRGSARGQKDRAETSPTETDQSTANSTETPVAGKTTSRGRQTPQLNQQG